MNTEDTFITLLEQFSINAPKDAVALRSASAQIISGWIKGKLPYPDRRIDGFVYIESSIEYSLEEHINNAVALENDLREAYRFHITKFSELVINLIQQFRNTGTFVSDI